MRNFRKLKTLEDYRTLDEPEPVVAFIGGVDPPSERLYVLRMLIRPKYGEFLIPTEVDFIRQAVLSLSAYDRERTGIRESWCYLTIRHGLVESATDDEFHFDGSSFRTDIIPERNYIWANKHPTEYKIGSLTFPDDFDPLRHNLFKFAEHQLSETPVIASQEMTWLLLSPFCLHRRPQIPSGVRRTFCRICFTDIEGRDINNTENPLIATPFYGRDPVVTFRNKLLDYHGVTKETS